jgi:flagellar motor protein MotB
MLELDTETGDDTPIWPIFGDLMAGLVGVFVLILVWTLGYQVELKHNLKQEVSARQQEQERRMVLEKALAEPLAAGRVTLRNGRIGISGNVLFDLNSNQLQPQGRALLKSLIAPLQVYLGARDELLMVSGFTDDLAIQAGNRNYEDNLELSAQRALTVTRALIEQGMPRALVFAAAFGAEQPVAPNVDAAGRSMNRRVEIAPVYRGRGQTAPGP